MDPSPEVEQASASAAASLVLKRPKTPRAEFDICIVLFSRFYASPSRTPVRMHFIEEEIRFGFAKHHLSG